MSACENVEGAVTPVIWFIVSTMKASIPAVLMVDKKPSR